jgi:adenosylcobalamin-dependent ribonucleoside-triphosphate reductase
MGSVLTEEKGLFAALNNCAFVSTKELANDLDEPFTFLMDASMLGIGVGFDTRGANTLAIHQPDTATSVLYVVADSREGWVDSVAQLLRSYFLPGMHAVTFDYTLIRPAGEPIRGFGGVSSGPDELELLHDKIRGVLNAAVGRTLSTTDIVDLMNLIGKCVVSGNVRRSAELALGEPDATDFLDLKQYTKNPQRSAFGWVSNNSVRATIGMDYRDAATRSAVNGEPGYIWLENMRAYSRLIDPPDYADARVEGSNPCVEQSLESYELCCLVETFPARHQSLDEYKHTLKLAYLYAKTVTLGNTQWPRTNKALLRNRRIGLSQSGIQQAVTKLGIEEYRRWCVEGYATVREYDRVYSDWFAIPRSIKVTSVKPSGTVSLLAGAYPGMHWPEDRQYIRRIRVSKHSDLLPALRAAGYHIEPCVGSEDSTVVVEFPVQNTDGVRTVREVSLWEQLSMAAFLQRYWADNQVSCTVTFDPEREGPEIAHALQYFQYQLKGVSFLPRVADGAYPQMPYESITPETYAARAAGLAPLRFGTTHEQAEAERFCDGASCVI